MDARRYAEKQGYVLKGTEKIWDSSLANMGLLFVNLYFRDRISAYLEAVYPPFWRRELDIEDIKVVKQCLASAGVDSSEFESFVAGEGKVMHDTILETRFDAGMYGVPTYVVGDEVFSVVSTCLTSTGSSQVSRVQHPMSQMRWYDD